ncbi:MAG: putative flap endonuclease-1-like 5' DNA nuclease, partial [Neolewinella sp.]
EAVVEAAPVVEASEPAEAAPAPKKVVKKVAKKVAAKVEPEVEPEVEAPASDAADKLTDINGIGPVIEGKLQAMGISTFAQIAAFTPEKIAEIDGELNFKGRIDREEWVTQAAKLA